jgi:hypothetical protein
LVQQASPGIFEAKAMDWTQAAGKLIELYGLPGIVIAVLLYAVRALFVKYTTAIEARADDGARIAVAMERNTSAIEALKELIKERT